MGGVARVRWTPETLIVGIAVVMPDGTLRDQNAAWRSMDRPRDRGDPAIDRDSEFLRTVWIDQARHFHEVIAGRCKLFTCLAEDRTSEGRTLLVAMPRGAEPPHPLTLLRLSMAGLLPIDPIGAESATASIPEPRFVMDLIVRTIEQTIRTAISSRPAVAEDRVSSGVADGTAVDDAHTAILRFLTPRQREILRLMGIGRSNAEIAAELGISMNTVKLHVSAILRRLDLGNRMQAIAIGARICDRRLGDS
ncbi:LuxR C-terminal-related transcriptional regulator [Rhodoplanes sp. TEM]|uniref:LuxR C-terminal-related transcriptional regulator n=1 Tax=Rhodoplanes tepidamans TaxID=200616 RepID=A0ABT5J6D1_RHOTP|nr:MULTISPECIES: LuxR C-terminal-related transcriptional regulator [Rhodoplanes]MDC7784987.1 LuxR C-terminal-related transcriptional regulator [Rhodoplanes tepidamans]MDC7985855.1 LuxR C-terminal-related transcriptional regulator [Rhodoplanes sp. TEM]MDQ0353783.1 DNA-binding CsgD family transcriptional regulator [Rhodoplanes tepidamans]